MEDVSPTLLLLMCRQPFHFLQNRSLRTGLYSSALMQANGTEAAASIATPVRGDGIPDLLPGRYSGTLVNGMGSILKIQSVDPIQLCFSQSFPGRIVPYPPATVFLVEDSILKLIKEEPVELVIDQFVLGGCCRGKHYPSGSVFISRGKDHSGGQVLQLVNTFTFL